MKGLFERYIIFLCCELRNQNKAILDALKNVSGAKYQHTVIQDGVTISLGADTLDELRALIGEPVEYFPPKTVPTNHNHCEANIMSWTDIDQAIACPHCSAKIKLKSLAKTSNLLETGNPIAIVAFGIYECLECGNQFDLSSGPTVTAMSSDSPTIREGSE